VPPDHDAPPPPPAPGLPQEDPFTRFLDPDQLAALQGATSGNLIGVGLEISPGPAAKDGSSTLVRAH
jgi:C-terminal processing protease CtpA/Prc